MNRTGKSFVPLVKAAIVYVVTAAGVTHLALGPGPRPDWSRPLEWLQSHPPEEAVAAALRLAAVALGGCLLVQVALAVLAHVVRWRPARALDRLTPRFVRGVVDGLLAVTVTASAVAPVPASARSDLPPAAATIQVRTGRAGDSGDTSSSTPPSPAVAPPQGEPAGGDGITPAADPPRARATAHIVMPGEHLWAIAAAQVAAARRQPADGLAASDVEPYWRAVCAANRDRLESGDVNLIYPGEVIELPAP